MSVDPRLAVIDKRLAGVGTILAVTGGKGGIGKSLVSSTLAALLARRGRTTGLLDLDLTGPCAHIVLGVRPGFPTEEFGIDPVDAHGIKFVSVTSFIGRDPVPLRGTDVTNALIELLAIVRWGALDYLIVDMPPGLGDAMLDAMRLVHRAEYLVVATDSLVTLETVERTLRVLRGASCTVRGVVQNMHRRESDAVASLAADSGVPFLGQLPFDEEVETGQGDVERLLRTPFASVLGEIAAEF
ncbi:MAG: Mrp/NBP35 family ATP-binding protein [bacterium]|nr:Mrp/NBP35 family ATP-binding protein [bacterium]